MDNLIEFQILSTLPWIRSLGDHLLDQYGLASSIGSQHIVYLTRNHPCDCLGKGIVWRVLELLSIKHSHILFWIIPGIGRIAPLNKMSRRHGCWSYVMWRWGFLYGKRGIWYFPWMCLAIYCKIIISLLVLIQIIRTEQEQSSWSPVPHSKIRLWAHI